MTILTPIRHAKASWTFEGLEDWARPLSRRGMKDCLAVSEVIAGRLPVPDLILTSDAARTIQTCELLLDGLPVAASRVRHLHELYLATDKKILELLEEHRQGCEHVVVVAHNPGLTDLYNRIVAEPIDNMPTLAVASIEMPDNRWTSVAPGTGRLLDYFTPKTSRAE